MTKVQSVGCFNKRKLLAVLSMVSLMPFANVMSDDLAIHDEFDLKETALSLSLNGSYFSTAIIEQQGQFNVTQVLQSGSDNQLSIVQIGNNNQINSYQIGDSNSVNGKQFGDNNSADIYQFGTNNVAHIEQHGDQYFLIEQYSDYGVVSVIQY
jgi:hypothetical protein